jgi:hypothetical protein
MKTAPKVILGWRKRLTLIVDGKPWGHDCTPPPNSPNVERRFLVLLAQAFQSHRHPQLPRKMLLK